jgi:hypothetical protein
MKTIIIALAALILGAPGAQARHYRPVARPVECTLFCFNLMPGQVQLGAHRSVIPGRSRQYSAVEPQIAVRPRDCYGIEWCGCWLRHHFGLADRSLNLARRWASMGHRTTPHAGAIIVWAHHVGILKSNIDGRGRALVLSGNDGHRVRLRERYVGGAIAYREL